jgi:hypothetical protein
VELGVTQATSGKLHLLISSASVKITVA